MTGPLRSDDLRRHRLIPIITIDDAGSAAPLADALVAGGIGIAEITLRTPVGLAAIARVADRADPVVGAGTVITPDDVDRAADAGARFVVSPGFDAEVVRRAQRLGLLPLPGIATAGELQAATRAGLDVVKFFPADRLGGLGTIRALSAPFPGMRFVPSGGVSSPDDALGYLADPAVIAVGGSWIAARHLLRAGDFGAVRSLAAAATQALDGAP